MLINRSKDQRLVSAAVRAVILLRFGHKLCAQNALAVMLGIPRQRISRWKLGGEGIPYKWKLKLMDIIDQGAARKPDRRTAS